MARPSVRVVAWFVRRPVRLLVGGGLFAVAVMAGLSACSSRPDNPDNVCAVFDERPAWYRDARRASERWSFPIATLIAFVHQESTFGKHARPPRDRIFGVVPWTRPSSAYGYAQAVDGTWATYQRETGRHGADRDDFGDALDFIGWYNDVSRRRNKIGSADVYNLYLAYHEGQAGYARGTHRKKPRLRKIARRVAQRADHFSQQLAGCEDGLGRRWWWPF